VWACDVDAASLHNPQADLCATIDGGKLTVAIKGAKHQCVDVGGLLLACACMAASSARTCQAPSCAPRAMQCTRC
jgi:hypothetical protein